MSKRLKGDDLSFDGELPAKPDPSVSSLVERRSVAGRKFYHRSIEQLHKTVSMLTNYVWTKKLRDGEHMWSIPVDQERDFDCILTDAIDELQELREAASRLSSPEGTRVKCDGNHAGPRCADPECWNDTASPAVCNCRMKNGEHDAWCNAYKPASPAATPAPFEPHPDGPMWWRKLLQLDGPVGQHERVGAFLRQYAAMLRRGHPWDVPETMANCFEVIAAWAEALSTPPASPAASSGPESREVAWVIEGSYGAGSLPTYWDGRGRDTFVRDHLLAIRFAREADAFRVKSWLLADECRVVEHVWIGGVTRDVDAHFDHVEQRLRASQEEVGRLLAEREASRRVSAASRPAQTCEWKEDDEGTWHTDCGNAWIFTDGGPYDNQQKFCGYCGQSLKVVVPAPPGPGAQEQP